MILKNKQFKFSVIIISIILLLAFTAENIYIEISSPDPSLTITTATNKRSYLLRQKVEINGNITLDGSPASDLIVAVQIDNPKDWPTICRTIQIGNPTQNWSINITDLFLTDITNNPTNTLKTNTEAKFGITLYNWQSTAIAVFTAFTVFDANMVPLVTKTWNGTLNPKQSVTIKYPIYIPAWACSGKALLVGNVYSKEPKTGGIALSLEKTAYFCISRTQQGQLEYPTLPPPPPQTTPGIYSTQIWLPPDPTEGNYLVYVLGQVSPIIMSSDSTTFNVKNSEGYPPQASFAYWPVDPYENMTVDFDASSSTPEGFNDTIIRYEWDFGDGTPKLIKEGTYIDPPDPTATHAYAESNQYIITLNVTDNEELWSTTSKPITVYPEFDPTANFTWNPKTPIINETITFDASNSVEGWSKTKGAFSPIVSYAWNFSDGTGIATVTQPQINHNFTEPGNYTVTLTITDDVDRSDSISAIIQVLNVTIKDYDLNHDGVIDGSDLILIARAYGSYPGHPDWNPIADINGDEVVDGSDVILVARHFGEDP